MKYERLTKRADNYPKVKSCPKDYETISCIDCGCCDELDEALFRLAELEDKIENGTLFELPCKVGDEIWWLYNRQDIVKDSCKSIAFCINNNEMRWFINGTILDGTIMFLTKAEAEKRLEELRGEVAEEVIMTGPIIVGDVPEVEYQTEVAEWKPTKVRRSGKRNNRKS